MYIHKKEVFILEAKRTPIGSFGGVFKDFSAVDLGVTAAKGVLSSLNLEPALIDEVIVGCVLQAGLGQAPARQVGRLSGVPDSAQAFTVNKVCSSGLKAVMLAADKIELSQCRCVLAGGIENMSQAPYLLKGLRYGARLGDTEAKDSLILDALWDPYSSQHMGNCAELCAKEFNISRKEQDDFAIESYRRAVSAQEEGLFDTEIVPVKIISRKAEIEVTDDEEPKRGKPDKIPSLKPVFEKEGTVTAANASSINDGAAMLVLAESGFVKEHNLSPIARLVAQSWSAKEPQWFTTAPSDAVSRLLSGTNKTVDDIDLFEINEAFSVVAIANQRKLNIPSDKLNIFGGAVALGHPVGASGARILTTLINALHKKSLKTGIAAICNGGGEATAVLIEVL